MVGDKRSNEETMNTPYTEAIGKWDTSINTMKQYHPTLICVPATEWEQMNEEIAQLREWKEAAIKSSSWNVESRPNKPYTFQMANKHDGSDTTMPEVDEKGWQPKEGEVVWLMDLEAETIDGPYKWNNTWRTNTKTHRLFPTKEAAEAYGKEHIKPEAPNYPLLLAELGTGKMLRSEDGYDLSWSRYTDRLTLYKGGIPTGVYTWSDVVEQVLEKHKGWRVV